MSKWQAQVYRVGTWPHYQVVVAYGAVHVGTWSALTRTGAEAKAARMLRRQRARYRRDLIKTITTTG